MVDPMGNSGGFGDFVGGMPLFFKLFAGLVLVLVLVIGTFITVIGKGTATWVSNNQAEVMVTRCRVVDKRSNVWGGAGDSSSRTDYYITFEHPDGARTELQVPDDRFGLIVVGDEGELTYQGTRFKGFERRLG